MCVLKQTAVKGGLFGAKWLPDIAVVGVLEGYT
jgi:hypothetical protein